MAKIAGVAAIVLVLTACASEAPEPYTCALGNLTGTWRVSYAEQNGNCGPLADETAVLSAETGGSGGGCRFAANVISSDKCRADQDFTCPLTDASGSAHWVGVLRHVGRGSLRGSYSLQVAGRLSCRSTYDVIYTEL